MHLLLTDGSMISVMLVALRFRMELSLPYKEKLGIPGPLGIPVSAKPVMYACKARAVASLNTAVSGELNEVYGISWP